MAGRRRRNSEAPMSLFSFQDIIAAVTGVIILITLLLTVVLISRTESTTQTNVPPPTLDELTARMKELEQARSSLQQSREENREEIDGLNSVAPITEPQISELTRKIAALTKSRDASSAAVNELRAKRKMLDSDAVAMQSRVDGVQLLGDQGSDLGHSRTRVHRHGRGVVERDR